MDKRKFGRQVTVIAACALAVVAVPAAALAFALQGKSAVPLKVAKNEIVQGDYITIGDTIDVQGNVDGDVIVAGTTVTIAGAVSGDVIVAARELNITGEVEGSVRAAAMRVNIAGTVGRNLNIWAQEVLLQPEANVGRNAYLVAERAQISGTVSRNLATRVTQLTLSGTVDGDARLEAGAEGVITLQPEAKVAGSLTYVSASADQLQRASTTSTLQVKYEPLPSSGGGTMRLFLFFRIISLFGMLVVGLVLVSLVPRYVVELVQETFLKQFWLSLAVGLLAVVGTPIGAFVLAITVIGLPLALMLIASLIIGLYLAQVIVGVTIGLLLFHRLSSGGYRGSLLLPMIVGVALYVAATSFPYPVGNILKIIAMVWGLGAMLRMKKIMIQQWR